MQLSFPLTFHNTNKALVLKTSFDPCLTFVNRKCGVSGKGWTIKSVDSVVLLSVFNISTVQCTGKKCWKQKDSISRHKPKHEGDSTENNKQKDTDRRKPMDNFQQQKHSITSQTHIKGKKPRLEKDDLPTAGFVNGWLPVVNFVCFPGFPHEVIARSGQNRSLVEHSDLVDLEVLMVSPQVIAPCRVLSLVVGLHMMLRNTRSSGPFRFSNVQLTTQFALERIDGTLRVAHRVLQTSLT